jgi:fatty-acyl-CoA synthase
MYPGAHARRDPERVAVVMTGSGAVLTYGQLEDRSARLANRLREAGFERGDVIALVSRNDARIFEVYWAAQRAGLYVTVIDHRLRPSEVRYIVEDSGAAAVFAGRDAQTAVGDLGDCGTVRMWVSMDDPLDGYDDYEQALAAASPEPPAHEPRGGDMLYSAGTTGRPKGVKPPLPDRDVGDPGDVMVERFGTLFGLDEHTVYLSPGPLHHAAPLRTCATVQALGGTVVVMERFDAEAALAAIEHHRVTHSQWVPTMFVRMLKLDERARSRYDLSTTRVALHAAAPCPVDVKRRMLDWWGPVLYEYYAATEFNGLTIIGPDEWLRRPGSVGRAAIGTIHVCGEDGAELPVGEVGDVYFERTHVPFEYHHDPAQTRRAQHPAHPTWTTVGDIGYVDPDGYLFLTDRRAFTIISGGSNIYPREIEDVLALHPLIKDVAVIGVPDEDLGEEVKAVVQLSPGTSASDELAEELIAYVRERIAAYKSPRSIDFVDRLPRTASGKLVKGDLRRRYVAMGAG